MKALVLAGGTGKRLYPITETLPKAMIPLAGKPVLEYVIEYLVHTNLNDIIIVVGPKKEQICDYFSTGKDFGANISYVEQKSPLGVEDAILTALPVLEKEEEFLIVHSDFVASSEIIRRAIEYHKGLDSDATIVITLVDDPTLYGAVEIDENAKIKKIIEKPKKEEAPSNYAAAGVYVFKGEFLKKLEETKRFDAAVQSMIQEDKTVYGMVWEKDWTEITYPWDILEANRFVLAQRLKGKGSFIAESAQIDSTAKIEAPVWICDDVIIRPRAVIRGPCFIGPDSFIGDGALIRDHTSIGKHVSIGFGVEIKNSLILDDSSVGRLSYIGESIIGRSVKIGAGTQTWNIKIRGGPPIEMNIDDKKVPVPAERFGAVIGENAEISINVSIFPGKKIGAGSTVFPGVIVEEDVPSNAEVRAKQEIQIITKKDSKL
ncbi:MAG: bifunctional sugar-1-phosphate nucleotidylyltransferase/acetyltransferase [Candidatus Freyarchaeota archaeon]